MSSRVETLRWRMLSMRLWSPTTIFISCPGCFFESTFRFAWLSTMVTSMSATAHCFCSCAIVLPRVVYWGNVKNSAKGVVVDPFNPTTFSCAWFVLFWPSIDCKSCSNSFTKFMAPPIIDAWSPCFIYTTNHSYGELSHPLNIRN